MIDENGSEILLEVGSGSGKLAKPFIENTKATFSIYNAVKKDQDILILEKGKSFVAKSKEEISSTAGPSTTKVSTIGVRDLKGRAKNTFEGRKMLVKVVKIEDLITRTNKKVTNIHLADESGETKLSLWEDQKDFVKKFEVDSTILLEGFVIGGWPPEPTKPKEICWDFKGRTKVVRTVMPEHFKDIVSKSNQIEVDGLIIDITDIYVYKSCVKCGKKVSLPDQKYCLKSGCFNRLQDNNVQDDYHLKLVILDENSTYIQVGAFKRSLQAFEVTVNVEKETKKKEVDETKADENLKEFPTAAAVEVDIDKTKIEEITKKVEGTAAAAAVEVDKTNMDDEKVQQITKTVEDTAVKVDETKQNVENVNESTEKDEDTASVEVDQTNVDVENIQKITEKVEDNKNVESEITMEVENTTTPVVKVDETKKTVEEFTKKVDNTETNVDVQTEKKRPITEEFTLVNKKIKTEPNQDDVEQRLSHLKNKHVRIVYKASEENILVDLIIIK